LVIDPGADPSRIADHIKNHQLKVMAYLITHGHTDHISALAELAQIFPAPVAIHPLDAKWAFGPTNALEPYYSTPKKPATEQLYLADHQLLDQLGEKCQVICTPGHSPGGVCFYFPSASMIFTGDTLFANSVGRTDFPNGDERLLYKSLKRLIALPGDTIVYTGHGPKTDILQEIKTNPFLSALA
jgi:glyoxylase-like metal-dependent hydrolase (beta-lactamase superfamily II)